MAPRHLDHGVFIASRRGSLEPLDGTGVALLNASSILIAVRKLRHGDVVCVIRVEVQFSLDVG